MLTGFITASLLENLSEISGVAGTEQFLINWSALLTWRIWVSRVGCTNEAVCKVPFFKFFFDLGVFEKREERKPLSLLGSKIPRAY